MLQDQFSIETGYFVFTLMPSLRCSLNCPHCYLSKEQRRNSPIMSLKDLEITCNKIYSYYSQKNIKEKTLMCYWYGGEPTEMGQQYFISAFELINSIFKKEDGYNVKHTVLTSLLTIDSSWFEIFKKYGDNHFQTSFDGLMRGINYVKKWERKVREAQDYGLEISTISVVNHELIKESPIKIINYLADLNIKETSWLPFMWNEQNDGAMYERFAPKMEQWSDFMIEMTKHTLDNPQKRFPELGQLWFILTQKERLGHANIASQTLFLLPEGDFVLPDYKNGYQEYMRKFGNILEQDFESILKGTERKSYLRKQVLKNNNTECLSCDHQDKCVMEFWKDNRKNDDCFGGKKYIEWVLNNYEKYDLKKFKNTSHTNLPMLY